MVMSKASTVAAYLAELPPERRKVLTAVRSVIRKNLPQGFRESMGYGMICYSVPLSRYPDTYNGQPLCYAALAAQKYYYAVYLMCVYGDSTEAKAFRAAFKKAGKKLDMGKSCVRFRSLDDLPLDAIGNAIASTPLNTFISRYEAARGK